MNHPRFEKHEQIRFAHCDPAGIVFYPQYFVLFNGLVEDWVTQGLGIRYAELIGARRTGMPTVNLQTDFRAISRFGDEVRLGLEVEALGGRSLTLVLDCHGAEGGLRVLERHDVRPQHAKATEAADALAQARAAEVTSLWRLAAA